MYNQIEIPDDYNCHLVLYTTNCLTVVHDKWEDFDPYFNNPDAYGEPVRLEVRSGDKVLNVYEKLTGYKGWVLKQYYAIEHFIDHTDILPSFCLYPCLLYPIDDNRQIAIEQLWIAGKDEADKISKWVECIRVVYYTTNGEEVKKEFSVDRNSLIEAIDYFIEQRKVIKHISKEN